jgi:hypothetical protein
VNRTGDILLSRESSTDLAISTRKGSFLFSHFRKREEDPKNKTGVRALSSKGRLPRGYGSTPLHSDNSCSTISLIRLAGP